MSSTPCLLSFPIKSWFKRRGGLKSPWSRHSASIDGPQGFAAGFFISDDNFSWSGTRAI